MSKQLPSALLIVGLMVLATLFPVASLQAQSGSQQVSITLEPGDELRQGRTALLRVQGPDIVQAQATFLGTMIQLHPTNVGDWVGFLAISMDATPGESTLDVFTWTTLEQPPTITSRPVTVLYGEFDSQDIEISYSLEPLLDPELNAENFDRIERVHQRTTPERMFTSFVQPIPGPVISAFGGFRVYNTDQLTGRHTGVDYRAVVGTPVGAASDGRVVFAEHLPIHGNHVIIDHGWGILTGYSHLSEIMVVPGQLVRQGEIIGLVGNTGRVQGPHLHWEMAVNGYWIDAAQFLTLNIPLPAPE
ncbi:MAG: M23 family metallopeptidase [Chloroflexi bacterium]|nr:M23 family metallopeptidase [Chloroflexota bacterium]